LLLCLRSLLLFSEINKLFVLALYSTKSAIPPFFFVKKYHILDRVAKTASSSTSPLSSSGTLFKQRSIFNSGKGKHKPFSVTIYFDYTTIGSDQKLFPPAQNALFEAERVDVYSAAHTENVFTSPSEEESSDGNEDYDDEKGDDCGDDNGCKEIEKKEITIEPKAGFQWILCKYTPKGLSSKHC
jgi:hypothetical protein